MEMFGSSAKLAKLLFPVASLVLGVSLVAMPIIWHQSSKHLALANGHSTADQTEATADQRKMSSSDRALTQRIRKAIHHDRTLSNYGKNIKIFVQNGKVALRGSVRSEQEKYNLGTKAADAAGQGNVSNQLDVTPLK
jgi:osmotically-inducible protein OsmY